MGKKKIVKKVNVWLSRPKETALTIYNIKGMVETTNSAIKYYKKWLTDMPITIRKYSNFTICFLANQGQRSIPPFAEYLSSYANADDITFQWQTHNLDDNPFFTREMISWLNQNNCEVILSPEVNITSTTKIELLKCIHKLYIIPPACALIPSTSDMGTEEQEKVKENFIKMLKNFPNIKFAFNQLAPMCSERTKSKVLIKRSLWSTKHLYKNINRQYLRFLYQFYLYIYDLWAYKTSSSYYEKILDPNDTSDKLSKYDLNKKINYIAEMQKYGLTEEKYLTQDNYNSISDVVITRILRDCVNNIITAKDMDIEKYLVIMANQIAEIEFNGVAPKGTAEEIVEYVKR